MKLVFTPLAVAIWTAYWTSLLKTGRRPRLPSIHRARRRPFPLNSSAPLGNVFVTVLRSTLAADLVAFQFLEGHDEWNRAAREMSLLPLAAVASGIAALVQRHMMGY
jgi:hypothetical protein